MGSADRGNPGSVAGHGQPIVNGSADPTALDGRLSLPVVAGNEQDKAVARILRSLKG